MKIFDCLCLYFRTTLTAITAFLDAFQKVADMATSSRGKFYHKCLYMYAMHPLLKLYTAMCQYILPLTVWFVQGSTALLLFLLLCWSWKINKMVQTA